MNEVETFRLACAIGGHKADDGGHMVEACPDESEEAREAREAAEDEQRPTFMPTPREGLEHASRCHGARIEGAMSDGVLVGHCAECNKAVARKNPRTGREEWLNGASPWTPEDACAGAGFSLNETATFFIPTAGFASALRALADKLEGGLLAKKEHPGLELAGVKSLRVVIAKDGPMTEVRASVVRG